VAGAVSTGATGAALAVAAPVALVDPQTRESYSEHFSNVGSGFRDTVGSTVDLAGARSGPSRAPDVRGPIEPTWVAFAASRVDASKSVPFIVADV
jgi:hypothetical protein